MVSITDLCSLDKSLELISGESSEVVSTISNTKFFQKNSLLFIGAKKFLTDYLACGDVDGSEVLVVNKKFYDGLESEQQDELKSKARAVLLTGNLPLTMSMVSEPFYKLKYEILNLQVDGRKMGSASIHPSAKIGENVFVGEDVIIEEDVTIMPGVTILPNVKIGKNTVVFPNVTIYPYTEIGESCRIHAGVAVGSDGFGYNYADGVHHKVWHFGGVKIGHHVEIGSNTSIDQGTFTPTLIGDGAKIDNLVQIGHNVELGPGVVLCGQVGMAGSSKVGPFSVFGGKAAIADGVEVGTGVQVAGAAAVTSNWGDGEKLAGYPARPLAEWLRGLAFIRKNSLKK